MQDSATRRSRISAFVVAVLCGVAGVASAQVYRWTDAQGVVHYSDTPHTRDQAPAQLPDLQSFHSPVGVDSPTSTSPVQAAASPSAGVPAPRITQPADGATIRDAQNELPVAVAVVLNSGQGLIYYVDGKPQNTTPTQAMTTVLGDVWRGTHQLSVAVVDAQGHVVSQSSPVTVYMKPPTVHRPGR